VNDYDTQLLESVEVRRRRLRDAVMFGKSRSRRSYDQNLLRMFIGLAVAAVVAAGVVGWSFLQEVRAGQAEGEWQTELFSARFVQGGDHGTG
jgi:hypothetical protein